MPSTSSLNVNAGMLSLVAVAAIGIFLCFPQQKTMVAANYEDDKHRLFVDCMVYVKIGGDQMDPSKDCCDAIQSADMMRLCHDFKKDLGPPFHGNIQIMVDWNKVLYVTKFCRKPYPPGTKCGDYTVPPTALHGCKKSPDLLECKMQFNA